MISNETIAIIALGAVALLIFVAGIYVGIYNIARIMAKRVRTGYIHIGKNTYAVTDVTTTPRSYHTDRTVK